MPQFILPQEVVGLPCLNPGLAGSESPLVVEEEAPKPTAVSVPRTLPQTTKPLGEAAASPSLLGKRSGLGV